jgi:hypothetical protein
MKPGELRVSIVTCPREPQYIHTTLASLFAADKNSHKIGSIDIFVDGPRSPYLEEYHTYPNIHIHYMDKKEIADREKMYARARKVNNKFTTRHINCCLGHYRARSVSMEGYKALLVLEDDVILRKNYIKCLSDCYKEIDKTDVEHWHLSLQDNHNLKRHECRHRGKYHMSYPGSSFYGFTGVFMPANTVQPVADTIHTLGLEKFSTPADLCMHELARKGALLEWGFFCSAWDITSHRGVVSTGLGGGRGSLNWNVEWRPVTLKDFG